jgi:hypothetical protein
LVDIQLALNLTDAIVISKLKQIAIGKRFERFKKTYLATSAIIENKRIKKVTIQVKEKELKLVLEKLDTVKLELLRLRAMLIPEDQATDEEKKEILEARKEIEKGSAIKLEKFVKELGC